MSSAVYPCTSVFQTIYYLLYSCPAAPSCCLHAEDLRLDCLINAGSCVRNALTHDGEDSISRPKPLRCDA